MSGFGGGGNSAIGFGGTHKTGSGGTHVPGVGFIKNLATDVKDAVIGLPMGIVQTVTHPIRSVEHMAEATWMTWSPLFHGHFKQFAQQTYDHPLAPLLDVATVFSLGASAGAELGVRVGAEEGILGKAARLKQEKSIHLEDPTGAGRHAQAKHLSTRPGRRLFQETVMAVEGTRAVPAWAKSALQRSRYESAFLRDMAGRVGATNLAKAHAIAQYSALQTAMKAGEVLSNPETAATARQGILASIFTNLVRHAPEDLRTTDRKAVVEKLRTGHYTLVGDPAHLNAEHSRLVTRLDNEIGRKERKIARWDAQRARHAELAHSLPKLSQELEHANEELARMKREGWVVATPARYSGPKSLARNEHTPLVEAQDRVARLEKLKEKARASKQIHERAVQELDNLHGERQRLMAQRETLQHRSFRQNFEHLASTEENFYSAVEDYGRHVTTRSLRKAAKDSQGRYILVPKHDAKMLGWEARDSSKFVQWLWRKPTRAWKMIQVGYAPRTITNNAVGNWALAVAREDPVNFVGAVIDATAAMRGRAAAQAVRDGGFSAGHKHWLDKWFGDELGNTFANTLGDAPGTVVGKMAKTQSRAKRIAQTGFYGIVHKTSDTPVRATAITAYLRKDPGVVAEMKRLQRSGLSHSKAFNRAVVHQLRKDKGLRDKAALHARRTAGDYFTIRPGLERIVHGLVPFYLWDRHIVRTTGNMVMDNPGRVAMMQQLSNEGVAQTEQILGAIPDFMKNAIPLGKANGRAKVLLTYSLNPFATIGDLAEAAQGLTVGGGESATMALSQTNPALSGLFEAITGTNVLSGAHVGTHGGILSSLLYSVGQNTPQVQLVKAAVSKDTRVTPKGNDFLYAKNDEAPISSVLGLPLRDVSLSRAEALKAGKKKKKTGFE